MDRLKQVFEEQIIKNYSLKSRMLEQRIKYFIEIFQ